MQFPYVIERGERLHARAEAADRLREARARDARAAADHGGPGGRVRAVRQPACAGRRAAQVGAVRPAGRRRQGDRRDLAPERRPRARVRRGRPAAPDDAGRQPQRRARERPPGRTRRASASAELGDGEQRRPGALVAARPRRADRARRRAGARDLRRRHRLRRPARRSRRADRLRLLLRERRAPARGADGVRRGAHVPDPRVARAAAAQPEEQYEEHAQRRARPRCPTSACRSSSGTRRSASSASRASTRRAGSARPTRACSRRSPPTSASPSRTRACSPRWSASGSTSRSLVEISPAAVVVMDADERVTGWNPAAAELFGYSADEAIGRPVDELVVRRTVSRDEGPRGHRARRSATGRAQRITRRARKDGTLVDVELMLVPLTRRRRTRRLPRASTTTSPSCSAPARRPRPRRRRRAPSSPR